MSWFSDLWTGDTWPIMASTVFGMGLTGLLAAAQGVLALLVGIRDLPSGVMIGLSALSRVILPIASWAAYAYIGNMTVVNFTDQYVLYGAIGALQAVLAFAGELIFVVAVARLIWIRDRFAPSRSE